MIAMENLIEQSILLNVISGCTMLVGGLYLVRYYYAEQLVRLHGIYSDEGLPIRALIHTGLAAGPYAILLLICKSLSLEEKLQCAAHFQFLSIAFCLVPLAILAREHFALDYYHLSRMVYYTITTSGNAALAALNRYFAASAIVSQVLISLYFLRNAKDSAVARIPELSYALGPFLRSTLQFIRDVLYPLELVLDYSIITQATRDKERMPSLPIRAFISPYINASLLIIYHKFSMSLGAMLLLSVATFCSAILLFLCARKEEHMHRIHYYSFAMACVYLYAIILEQFRITGFISRKVGCQLSTAAAWYVMPYVCLNTFLLNAYIHSTGQKQVSLFATFSAHVFYIFILFCAGVVYGFAYASFSILRDRIFLVGVALSSLLSLTVLYYMSRYSRHPTDLFCVALFYMVVYIHALLY